MRERYLPALIMLIAGAITCILDISNKTDLLTSLKRLLIVLIVFYIIGLIAKEIIVKTLIAKRSKDDQTDTVNGDNSDNKLQDEKENNNENIENNK